ncbi:MAG TPA: cyclase family protein [Alicyclobacillus sp.]|nr:cyclase family protein [Alicyclobacillus sp.]
MKLIDLSVAIEHNAPHEPWKPQIHQLEHDKEGLEWIYKEFGAKPQDLVWSNGLGASFEEIQLITHAGTHIDAPWHYGPVSEGRPAKTVDQLPLEWFFSDGVILDLRHKQPGEYITIEDLTQALMKIGYRLKPFDIVMLMTGCDKKLGSTDYFRHPGMSRESTLWLVEQGIMDPRNWTTRREILK